MESLANLFRQMAVGEPAAWFLFVMYLVWPVMMLAGGAWLVYKDCRKELTIEQKKERKAARLAVLKGVGIGILAIISFNSIMGLLGLLLTDETKMQLAKTVFTLLGFNVKM